MESTPSLETIRHAWEHLRPLIYRQINQPSRAMEKALAEEVMKFDTIVKGDLKNVVALFREAVHDEHVAHERTKTELQRVRAEQERLHKELKRLTLPKSPDLNARMPSPIDSEEGSEEYKESDF